MSYKAMFILLWIAVLVAIYYYTQNLFYVFAAIGLSVLGIIAFVSFVVFWGGGIFTSSKEPEEILLPARPTSKPVAQTQENKPAQNLPIASVAAQKKVKTFCVLDNTQNSELKQFVIIFSRGIKEKTGMNPTGNKDTANIVIRFWFARYTNKDPKKTTVNFKYNVWVNEQQFTYCENEFTMRPESYNNDTQLFESATQMIISLLQRDTNANNPFFEKSS